MYVYEISNTKNNKKYIGVTKDVKVRFEKHKRETRRVGRKYILTHPLYSDMRNFGVDIFSVNVLEETTETEAYQKEKHWIEKLNTLYPNGYNLTTGGEEGKEYSERTKRLIGKEKKNDWKDPQLSEKMMNGLRKGTDTFIKNSQLSAKKTKKAAIDWAIENPDIILNLPGKKKKEELKPLWEYIEQETGRKDIDTINVAIHGSMSTVVTFEMLQEIAKKHSVKYMLD